MKVGLIYRLSLPLYQNTEKCVDKRGDNRVFFKQLRGVLRGMTNFNSGLCKKFDTAKT